jgi:hypothetical protein
VSGTAKGTDGSTEEIKVSAAGTGVELGIGGTITDGFVIMALLHGTAARSAKLADSGLRNTLNYSSALIAARWYPNPKKVFTQRDQARLRWEWRESGPLSSLFWGALQLGVGWSG